MRDLMQTAHARMVLSADVPIRRILRHAASNAASRLTRVQEPSGAFKYEHDYRNPTNRYNTFNTVRMAGATYALSMATDAFQGQPEASEFLKATRRAIEFLLFACEVIGEPYAVRNFDPDKGFVDKAPLGASALLANALLYTPVRHNHSDELDRLVEGICEAQLSSGAFRHDMVSTEPLGSQRYYPGEALLLLARLAELGDARAQRIARRSFSYYRRLFKFDPHPALVLWHTDTWSRMAMCTWKSHPDEALEYLAFCRELVLSRVPAQLMDPHLDPLVRGGFSTRGRPGVSSSLYLEAMARYGQALRVCGQVDDELQLEHRIQAGVQFLLGLQVSEADCRGSEQAEFAFGACHPGQRSTLLRIDHDQHFITALLAVLEGGWLCDDKHA